MNKPRGRYQADTVLHPNNIWDRIKYIFTIVDHFTKYAWVIQLNNKKAETILRVFNNASPHIIFLSDFRLITEESSITIFLNKSESKDIARIYGVSYSPSTIKQLRYSIELFNFFLPQQKIFKGIISFRRTY